MVLRCAKQELDVIQVWWGIGLGMSIRPMLTCLSIFRSVHSLRGWDSSRRVRYLLGVNLKKGGHCGVCFHRRFLVDLCVWGSQRVFF